MKKWIAMVATVMVAVALLAFCLYGLPLEPTVTDPTEIDNAGILKPSTPNVTSTHSGSSDTTSEPIITNPPESQGTVTVQYVPETVENSGSLPILKWVCLLEGITGGQNGHTWREDPVRELNQMLEDRNKPFRVQLVILDLESEDWVTSSDWFSRPEVLDILADADMVFGCIGADKMLQYLSPITKEVVNELKNAVPHKINWRAATIGSEIYAIPIEPKLPYCSAWMTTSDFLDENDLTPENFEQNYWEVDDILKSIYKKNNNRPFMGKEQDGIMTTNITGDPNEQAYPRILYGKTPYLQMIGECFAIDHSSVVPSVVNILETDTVRNIQEAIIRYKAAGYVSEKKDEAVLAFAYGLGGHIDAFDEGAVRIPGTDAVYMSQSSAFVCGILNTTKYREEAVMLFELIGEDEVFRNQLLFGKEGRDYTTTDGRYQAITEEDGTWYCMKNLSAHSYFSDVMGDYDRRYIVMDGMSKLETYRYLVDTVEVCYYPIIFDFSGFEQEMAALKKLREYYKFFTNEEEIGKPGDKDYQPAMTKENYDKMLQAFKDAGSDRIIEELQLQLNAWLANNVSS